MIENCENTSQLLRDGTSQQQRLIKALLPDYVKVDERSMSDLIEFANKLSEQFKYYDLNNSYNGDWEVFFKDQVINELNHQTEPHYALFIAFLELFKYAQNSINTITQRHLDFYYKDVLKLEIKPEVSDQVFVIFELAKDTTNAMIPSGTSLDAGEDQSGEDQIYNTERDVFINRTKVKSLKALFYNKENGSRRLYASPIANSANGLGAPIETSEPKWRTFGNITNPGEPYGSNTPDRPQANIGFAIASPTLFLEQGNRAITFTLTVNSTASFTNAELQNAFTVSFSGEEEWIIPEVSTSKAPSDNAYKGSSTSIIIKRTLTEKQPSIVSFDNELFEEPFETEWPVAKIEINKNNNSNPYIYDKLKGLTVSQVSIKVDVLGVKNLVLQNDQGTLDPSSPFRPFGSIPQLTSSFYVGSQEIFRKQVKSIDLNITWKGLPDDPTGFSGYYHDYLNSDGSNNNNRRNLNFKAGVSVLNNKNWEQLSPLITYPAGPYYSLLANLPNVLNILNGGTISLPNQQPNLTRLFNQYTIQEQNDYFDSQNNQAAFSVYLISNDRKLKSYRKISVNDSTLHNINSNPKLQEFSEYDINSQIGFLRLDLANVDFGHNAFQLSYATQALKASQPDTPQTNNVEDFPLPNAPYTPVISDFSVDYTATEVIDLDYTTSNQTEQSFDERVSQFYHVNAFGVSEQHPYITTQSPIINIVPTVNDEGSLYLGFEDMLVPQTLSLLVKVAEGSANPDLPVQEVKWHYLSDNEWYSIDDKDILSDGTNGLLNSGVIVLQLSKNITSDNTLLESGLSWLKVSVEDHFGAICDIIEIKAQATVARFENNDNDPSHFEAALKAESITEFVNSQPGVKSVSQPYASFGGHPKETDIAFYTRVSERLRHKQRAISIWDYERLVLEAFPKIYKVKCINHTQYISQNNLDSKAPGHVSLAIVSNLRNQNAVNLLQPQTSLAILNEIYNYIIGITTPALTLHVKNPIFEEIRVNFNVKFYDGKDAGYYTTLLNDEIKAFLAPWAFETAEIFFGGKIESSVILNFIEERSYVDYVTCFSMDHLFPDGGIENNVEVAISTTPASILTSVEQHDITVLETEYCECDDNVVGTQDLKDSNCGCDETAATPPDPTFGVGGSDIGGDFIVGDGSDLGNDGVGNMEIGNDFEVE